MPKTEVLRADRVEEVFDECRLRDDDVSSVAAEGIVTGTLFARDRLEEHRAEVAAMLSDLPTEFQSHERGGGGGWSFVNACMDRHGRQWTGLHQTMDKLFQLGLALGEVRLLVERDLWSLLPGGMPYYVVEGARQGARS